MDISKLKEAEKIAGHRDAKVKQYNLLKSCPDRWINLVAKDADHTGRIQASIDRPRDVEFSLPKYVLLRALANEIHSLEANLKNLGVTGIEPFEHDDEIPF